jgi:hypothetical protein
VRWVGRIKVSQDSSVTKGITDSIQDEDGNNQACKDLVGKAGSQEDIACQVEESSNSAVDANPKRNPSVKCKKGYIHGLGHVVNDREHDEEWTCTTDNAHWLPSNERIDGTDPSSSQDGLNDTDIAVGNLAVDGSKGQCRGDDTQEHEKRDGNRLLVEIDHFLRRIDEKG